MTTRYVDPAATGANNGTGWTDAWTSLQTAADTAVAGDIVYCRGTQVLSGATIDFDTNAGTNAAGWIKFIGCNASGTVDGTRFIVDANGAAINGITTTSTVKMVWFENIEVKNTSGDGKGWHYASSGSSGMVFINCCANNCYVGFNINGLYNGTICYRCVAYSNRLNGFSQTENSSFIFCVSRDNTYHGFPNGSGALFYGCVSHGNGERGFSEIDGIIRVINCVADGNGTCGIQLLSSTNLYGPLIFASRITNHSGSGDIGIDANSEPVITGFCYFEDNDGDNIQNATLHQFIPLEGTANTSNLEDLANTNEGYVDKTNHDFSTNYVDSGDPDLRRTAITLPWS